MLVPAVSSHFISCFQDLSPVPISQVLFSNPSEALFKEFSPLFASSPLCTAPMWHPRSSGILAAAAVDHPAATRWGQCHGGVHPPGSPGWKNIGKLVGKWANHKKTMGKLKHLKPFEEAKTADPRADQKKHRYLPSIFTHQYDHLPSHRPTTSMGGISQVVCNWVIPFNHYYIHLSPPKITGLYKSTR